MRRISVLWLIEHIVREMDVACAVKSLLQARHGIDLTIRNIYYHARELLKGSIPSVVVFPFLYLESDLAVEDYVEAWPGATYFNLACEQIFYNAHVKIKAPGDEFTRHKAIHHAWGDFYKDYLVESGVPGEHVFLNGNPVYQLYKDPYNKYFKQRDLLAGEYGLDPSRRWVFIPENYKWAFFSDEKLLNSVKRGGDMAEHLKMRSFCYDSLGQVLRWCNEVAGKDKLEIIFRPRPATNSKQMEGFFHEQVGLPEKHLHFTKGDTVREWIMASDVVMSSFSTSLIEAAVAGKPVYMLEPLPIPDPLQSDWYRFVPRIKSSDEFEQSCHMKIWNHKHELQTWAEEEMLSNGDPIERLADFIAELAGMSAGEKSPTGAPNDPLSRKPDVAFKKARWSRRIRWFSKYSSRAWQSLISAARVSLGCLVSLVGKRKTGKSLTESVDMLKRACYLFNMGLKDRDYFNPFTHENDVFTDADINRRVEAWHEVL